MRGGACAAYRPGVRAFGAFGKKSGAGGDPEADSAADLGCGGLLCGGKYRKCDPEPAEKEN